MKVCFDTFGCRLNKAEALQSEAAYLAGGWTLTNRHADADLIVVRGCSVTSKAQRECEKLVANLKRHYPTTALVVEGCLPHREGVHRADQSVSVLPIRTARAYLKAQDGCSGHCTFCIVPQFRGKPVSVAFSELTDRARRFIDSGYREIVLTGCNLALYASEGKRLPELLSALAELDSACRIRLGSVEPGSCALETVHAMAEHAGVCRHLHLPFQSGSANILLAMRRPYKPADVENAVRTANSLMPDIAVSCDMMTGFPGETDIDFTATYGLFKRLPFSDAHVFPYSRRPGTVAGGLPTQVPHVIRTERARRLSELATEKKRAFARKFMGRTVEIVVENDNDLSGWTSERIWCSVTPVWSPGTDRQPQRKQRLRYRVTGITTHGRLIGYPLPD